VYLINNEPVTLIDAGPNTSEASKVLKRFLSSIGLDIKDIQRIIITHAHPDHCGLVPEIVRISGAPVYMHPLEGRRFSGDVMFYKERLPFAIEAGIPMEVLKEMAGEQNNIPQPGLNDVKTRELNDGDEVLFDKGKLLSYHLPGHSPGHICLYGTNKKNFFSGDFLLPHITPNPVVEPDSDNPGRRLPTLKQYLNGLDLLEKMEISLVCPGHGGVFNDYLRVIEVGRRHHRLQNNRIMDKLKERALSTFQLSMEMYPGLEGWEIFLGLSEVQAHLDYLLEKNKLSLYKKQGIAYYSIV